MPAQRDPVAPFTTEVPWAALGLAVGPAAFISAWIVGGAQTPDYSAVYDAISRIAAVDAPQRVTMTAGFVVYGLAVSAGSIALRRSLLHRTWPLALINGAATIGVALTPLDRSDLVDTLHGVTAGTGYVSIALLQLASAAPLRASGRPRLAAAATAMGIATAACLVGTTVTDANGLFQRLGLTIGDVWLVATGIGLFRAVSERAACT